MTENKVDLISREALKKKLQARHDNGDEDFDKGYNIGIETAIDLIDNAQTVEERPQGEWITVHYSREELNVPQKASMLDFVKCLFCETIHQGRHNFCSRCGADMRGVKNE